jgi:hypothetical protein
MLTAAFTVSVAIDILTASRATIPISEYLSTPKLLSRLK